MTFAEYRSTPVTPLPVLSKLIAAGLGDVPQAKITREEYEDAMGRDWPAKRVPHNGPSRRTAYHQRRQAYLSEADVPDGRVRRGTAPVGRKP